MANDSAITLRPSLLLLPPPPSPATSLALKAAYQPSIAAALIELSSHKGPRPSILEITLPCPGVIDRLQVPRSQLFETTQHLLAGVYSLICTVCAHNSIEPDGAGGVDYRIILLASDDLQQSDNAGKQSNTFSAFRGPIVEIETFALTRRRWQYIFSVDGEKGEGIFNQYLNLANRTSPPVQGEIHKVAGGISIVSTVPGSQPLIDQAAAIHSVVAVGGTFDHLHAGHKLLLTATALLLQPSTWNSEGSVRMIVGITGDELLKNKKYAEYLLSWKEREENVVDFLKTVLSFTTPGKDEVERLSFDEPTVNGRAIHTKLVNAALTIECVEIQDPFGPTITDESVSALVVSAETRSGGAAVNAKRVERGWKTLEVFEVDVLDTLDNEESTSGTEEFAAKISSTAIRKQMFEKKLSSF